MLNYYYKSFTNKSYFLIICVLTLSLTNCAVRTERTFDPSFKRHVGDVEFNALIDDPNFKVEGDIEQIGQYFHYLRTFPFPGDKNSLVSLFHSNYKPVHNKNQNGFIRIRFVVNEKGESGRFRITESDLDFRQINFKSKVTSQLLNITRNIDLWNLAKNNLGESRAYYMHLIFKIRDGEIVKIKP